MYDWLNDRYNIASEESYRDLSNIQGKVMRHKAFEAELEANKERLDQICEVGATRSLSWTLEAPIMSTEHFSLKPTPRFTFPRIKFLYFSGMSLAQTIRWKELNSAKIVKVLISTVSRRSIKITVLR